MAAARGKGSHKNHFTKHKQQVGCSYCGKDYRTMDPCYKLHGYPPKGTVNTSTKASNSYRSSVQGWQPNQPKAHSTHSSMPQLHDVAQQPMVLD